MTPNMNPLEIMVDAFPGIPHNEAEELISAGDIRKFPPETILCHENAIASTFYIILEGNVRVTKLIDANQVRMLKTLGAGDFFGEMALIHDAPRAATVTTTTPITVIEIRKDAFDSLMRRSASLARAMVREVSRRLRENDNMTIEDLRLKSRELALAYQRMVEQEYARNDALDKAAQDMRGPMKTTFDLLSGLEENPPQGKAMEGDLQELRENMRKIANLINEMLFEQALDPILVDFQPTDLSQVLSNLIDQFAEQVKAKNVRLQLNTISQTATIVADPAALQKALGAIVDNALKYSPVGGDITIRMGKEKKYLWAEIQDQGAGIEPEILPQIFERYYHQERGIEGLHSGRGLGLAIARQIILEHGGEITVSSKPGKGSTFKVRLPIS
ncbi:MAG: ATP-binding protein [Anaerolineales bacterium]